jgi:uncharacterized protein YeeX (DUF496 family)
MQRSELYRRGIVMPNSEEAKKDLLDNNVSLETDVTFLDLENYVDFEEVWSTGIFSEINAICQVMIDDYEEEIIDWIKADHLIAAINKNRKRINSKSILHFFDELIRLAQVALDKRQPLFFIF